MGLLIALMAAAGSACFSSDSVSALSEKLPGIVVSYVSLSTQEVSTVISSKAPNEIPDSYMVVTAALSPSFKDLIKLSAKQIRQLHDVQAMVEADSVLNRAVEGEEIFTDAQAGEYQSKLDDVFTRKQLALIQLLRLRGAIRRLGVERFVGELSSQYEPDEVTKGEIDFGAIQEKVALNARSSLAEIEKRFEERCHSCMNDEMRKAFDRLEFEESRETDRDPGLHVVILSYYLESMSDGDEESSLPALLRSEVAYLDAFGSLEMASGSTNPGSVDSLIFNGLKNELVVSADQISDFLAQVGSDEFLRNGAKKELASVHDSLLEGRIDVKEATRLVQDIGSRVAGSKWSAFLEVLLPHQKERLNNVLESIVFRRTGVVGWVGSTSVHRRFKLSDSQARRIKGHVEDYLDEVRELSLRLESEVFAEIGRSSGSGVLLSRVMREVASIEDAGVGMPLILLGKRNFFGD